MELSSGRHGPTPPAPPGTGYSSWNAAVSASVPIAPGSTLTSLLPMAKPKPSLSSAGNGKRPLVDPEAIETKRLKRLEKNRESARECRRRKKENKERLEAQLATLEEENLNLRLRLKVGDEAEDAENAEILEIKEKLHDMVSKGVAEGQILQTMDLLTERFADYGSTHTSAADFHLSQLSRLLLPTLTTRVCMHAVLQAGGGSGGGSGVGQADGGTRIKHEAAAPPPRPCSGGVGTAAAATAPTGSDGLAVAAAGAPSSTAAGSVVAGSCRGGAAGAGGGETPAVGEGAGTGERGSAAGEEGGGAAVSADSGGAAVVDMWSSLVDVLEATEEQQATMRGQVGAIAELARDLEGTTEILERLRLLLADRNQTLDGEMAAIQRILTPTQSAKFVLWVSKNKACVHMLNQLWDKLHGGDPSS